MKYFISFFTRTKDNFSTSSINDSRTKNIIISSVPVYVNIRNTVMEFPFYLDSERHIREAEEILEKHYNGLDVVILYFRELLA